MAIQQKTAPRYYGWNIVVALAITETISWGIIYYAFAVFITATEQEMGWTRTEITGAFSLGLLVTGAMAFLVGNWIDRHGARWLMTVGSLLAVCLLVAWARVQALTELYAIWVGLGVCGALLWYEPAFTVVAQWFDKKRTRALAIITFAAGFASTIFIPLSDALLQQLGWRDATVVLAMLLGVITIPLHALVLRHSPQRMGLLPDGESHTLATSKSKIEGVTLRDALRSPSFWWLALAFGLAYLASNALRFHVIPLLMERGISATTAAFASGSIGALQVAGRLVFAPLDQRLPIRRMVGGVFALEALSVMVIFLSPSSLAVGVFIILFGAGYGAQTLARPSILAELVGSTHYGRISSVLVIVLTLSSTLAPVGASWLYDQVGSYEPLIALCIVVLIGAVISSQQIRTISKKSNI
jgi:MFS family permease